MGPCTLACRPSPAWRGSTARAACPRLKPSLGRTGLPARSVARPLPPPLPPLLRPRLDMPLRRSILLPLNRRAESLESRAHPPQHPASSQRASSPARSTRRRPAATWPRLTASSRQALAFAAPTPTLHPDPSPSLTLTAHGTLSAGMPLRDKLVPPPVPSWHESRGTEGREVEVRITLEQVTEHATP